MQQFDAGAAVFGVDHFHIVFFEQAGERENVAHVVVDHQDGLAEQRGIGLAQVLQNAALFLREIAFGAMQQQDRIVQQALQRIARA